MSGSERWKGSGGTADNYVGPLSLVADINMDGQPEIVAGNTVYRNNGTILWRNTSLRDGFNAVGNFDDDPYPEIVLVTAGNVYLLDYTGKVKWGPVAVPGGGMCGAPTVADFDGDGRLEIGVAGAARYVVFDTDGKILWQSVTSDYSSQVTGSSVFDFEGDGQAEVIYGDEHFLRIYRGRDGAVLFQTPNPSGTAYEYPVIADIDNDNRAELVVVANDPTKADNIRVFEDKNDNWVNTRKIWNQHTYHITNINDDGTIPVHEENNWEIYNNYRCNVLLPEEVHGAADITVSYITVDQSSYPESVNASARIGNGGATGQAAGVEVVFYDGDPLQGGSAIGTILTAGTIASGTYTDVSMTWSTPSSGSHILYAVADKDNKFNECREDNNSASASITLGEGPLPEEKLPDLSISPSDVTLVPPDSIEGQPAEITAVIHNAGTSGAADVTISFFDGDPQEGGLLIGFVTKSTIDAGATAFSEIPWDTFGESGRNYIHVVVDPQNLIVELSESNNSTLVPVDVAPPSKPDLAVTSSDIDFSSLNPGEGEPLTVSAVIHNLGTDASDVDVSLYDGDPLFGGTLLFETTLGRIIPFGGTATVGFEVGTIDLSGDHNFTVTVDPANRIGEISESNNTAWKALTVGSSGLGLSVSTDKGTYTAYENAGIGVNLENFMSSGRSGTLSLKILDTSDNVVAVVGAGEPVALAAGESKAPGFTWNTAQTLSGSYKVSCFYTENGNVIARDYAPFLIEPVKSISAKVITDKIRYPANAPVTVTSTVSSESPNDIFSGLTTRVSLKNTAGEILFSEDKPIQILTRGALIQLKSTWNTAANPKGIYPVTLEVFEGGALLGSSTTSFEILGSSATGGGLTGSLGAEPNPVFMGRDETIGWTVTNSGNENIENLTLTVLIVDPDTEELKETFSTNLNLPLNASASGSFICSTLKLKTGFALAVLHVSSAALSQPKTLASATFLVEAGLDAEKSIADAANLLVWVNGKMCSAKGGDIQSTCRQECVRVDLFERMLEEAGHSFRIVTTAKDFQKELRNPAYTDFLILGDRHPIEDHFGDELREQVHSGKGLLSSLYLKHGQCEGTDYGALLGVRYRGRLPGESHVIALLESVLSGAERWDAAGEALKVDAIDSKKILAWIEGSGSGKCAVGRVPAIVENTTGLGRTLFFAFDLGATLNDENYAEISSLIKKAVVHIHRFHEEESFHPFELIPVEITLKSLGGAFDLGLSEAYPEEIRLFDPESESWITENPWSRSVTLAAGETRKVIAYALAPELPGTYTLITDVSSRIGGTSQLWETLTAEITVVKDIPTMLSDVSAKLAALQAPAKERGKIAQALKSLDKVKKRAVRSERDCEANIADILKAIDHLLSIPGIDCAEVRLLLDDLLMAEEGRLYTWSIRR